MACRPPSSARSRRHLVIHVDDEGLDDELRDPLRSAKHEGLHLHGGFENHVEVQRRHVLTLQLVLLIEGTLLHSVYVVELHRHAERNRSNAVGGRNRRAAHVRPQLGDRLPDVAGLFGFLAHFTPSTSIANICCRPHQTTIPTYTQAERSTAPSTHRNAGGAADRACRSGTRKTAACSPPVYSDSIEHCMKAKYSRPTGIPPLPISTVNSEYPLPTTGQGSPDYRS